jgi:hypothetical protein
MLEEIIMEEEDSRRKSGASLFATDLNESKDLLNKKSDDDRDSKGNQIKIQD